MRQSCLSSWKRLCAALLLLAIGLPLGAGAGILDGGGSDSDAPFDITADSIEYESQRNVYVARGNVLISQPGRTLTADWVAFSNVTRQGIATGSVVFSEANDILYAEVLSFEIDTMKGVVLEGFLDARGSGFEMTGETGRRTGEETYVFDEGTFTTCHCPQEEDESPWQIRAKKADVEVGGYATARNTSFDILGVPVIWFPWMRYPVKTERETGFLLPTFSVSGDSGARIGFPFFWAARPNLNVTITPNYLFERGFKPELDVEYVFGERSYGSLFATIIDDDDIDEDSVDTPFDSRRWALEWIHDHHLPGGWRAKVDATLFSDNLFARDFNEFGSYEDNRYLESKTFVETRFGPLDRYGFLGGVRWADDLQNPDDLDRDDYLLQRLPELQLTGLPQPLPGFAPGLYASFAADFTHFFAREDADDGFPRANLGGGGLFLDTGIDAIPDGEERNTDGNIVTLDGDVIRQDGSVLTAAEYLANLPPGSTRPLLSPDGHLDNAPLGPENDRRFQVGEPLADQGQRLVLNPRIGMPFRIADVVEVYPEVGFDGTFYQSGTRSTDFRGLFTAMLDTRMRLRRGVDLPFDLGRAVHLMEPRLVYTGVTSTSQGDNPLFVPRPGVAQQRIRQFELWNVTRNPSDRIESVNAVTAGLGNRFYVPGEEGGPPKLFADLAFSTQHDFGNTDLSSFYVEGSVYPIENLAVRFNLGFDLDDTQWSEGLLEARYSTEEGHDLGFSYRYLREIPRFFESFRGFDESDNRYEDFEQGFQRINQIAVRGRLPLTRNWAISHALRYSFEGDIVLTNRAGVEYISECRCWAIRVEVGDDRSGGFDFNIRWVLIGLGDDDVRPFARGRSRATRDPYSGSQN